MSTFPQKAVKHLVDYKTSDKILTFIKLKAIIGNPPFKEKKK